MSYELMFKCACCGYPKKTEAAFCFGECRRYTPAVKNPLFVPREKLPKE